MTKPELSPFERLAAVNVNDHTEKKNGLTYLSWPWAVDQLLRADPAANWEFHDPVPHGKGTWMVACTVTAFGVARKMFLPVMDHRNKSIQEPDSFAVNTAMMRCLVKAIALHGLGLYIYAGEDLPDGEESPASAKTVAQDTHDNQPTAVQNKLRDMHILVMDGFENGDDEGMSAYLKSRSVLDADEQVAFWSLFDSKTRAYIKKLGAKAQSGNAEPLQP